MSTSTAALPRPQFIGVSMKVLIQRSGIARQTIHFYLRKGLLPEPRRTSRTYALYSPETLELLHLIRQCQSELRLSLDEILEIFIRADYDVARIHPEILARKGAHPSLSASNGARSITEADLLAALRPPATRTWIAELHREGILPSPSVRFHPDTVDLICAGWDLQQHGVTPKHLKDLNAHQDAIASAEFAELRNFTHAKQRQIDYKTAVKVVRSLEAYVQASVRAAFQHAFLAKTHRSADLFVGPNQKHVYPSETLLTKMGLNREIDRLLHKLGRDPEDRKSLYDLARAYYLRSDWLNLHRVTQKILQIDPLNPRAVADMSRALIYLGRVDESVATIEERLKRGPDPLLHFRLGQCLVVRARDRGTVSDLLDAIVRKQQLSAEALCESSNLPGINRWIRLDLALDNLSVSDPLELNQPTVQGLEALYREYELTSDKGLSILSRISLATRKMLAAYSLYLVYRRHRHPKTGQLLRRVIQMDPDSVLANRVPHLKQVSA